MIKIVLIYLTALLLPHLLCKPPLDDKKDRVVEKVLKEAEHFASEHHSKDYDHEAFLGEDAKEFDQLTPQESTKRLGIIVDKIDKDKDGLVSFEELREWIQYTQNKYLANDIDAQWNTHNPNKNDTLDWHQYRKSVYGIVNDLEVDDLDRQSANEGFSYKKLLKRDRRRWDAADINIDGVLNREEFAAFLHPEEMSHMRDLVVYETLEDIDKDGDKKISVDEYIGDMYQTNGDDEEPYWVQNEKEQFKLYRDKDKDGYMDIEEVKEWILPTGFDHAEAEAKHLIYESDSDADQKLTKDEILAKYDLFVGSQVTDFGEALARHDEF